MTSTTRRGLLLAAGLLLGWLGSALLLSTSPFQWPPALVVLAVLLRTVLQTGLFIVAHDAMHGSLWPGRPRANRLLGQAALMLYAALPYERCQRNHGLHHRHAGTAEDPDHHPAAAPGFWRWYGRFMASYLGIGQLTLLVGGWLVAMGLAARLWSAPLATVVLYGAMPLLFSSLQLFVVGTYLPHRGASGPHRARSLAWPEWLSLLGCFHFGYHLEHHAFPDLPWHQLPAARR